MTAPRRFSPTALTATALMALWLAMMVGGAGPLDRSVLAMLYSGDRPAVRDTAIAVTLFGQWQAVILVSLLVAGWLLFRRQIRAAALLLVTTLTGRVLVELQKLGIGRLRPDELDHLVPVKSLSFPSAHAANSMILLLSIATIAVPPAHRRWAVPLALLGTFLVGISRPLLGVHYPSDVIGGWSFGAAWVLMMLALSRRWSPEEQGCPARR